ncbi:thioesterase II family protein, partial [Burkholderia pseudomallei]|uniref:thioesterase II family protein n=1 Tax=Burkholderia pseudomallei TaxID=28450 RepID=UPI0021167F9F
FFFFFFFSFFFLFFFFLFFNPLIEHAEPIVEALADIVPPLLDLPYAFFGHSMGALIAFDLAHLLRARGFAQPLLFVASGRSAPRFRWRDAGIQTLPDEAFIAAVRDYNGTPEALIADPALRELWLPRLRADLTISATYRYVGPPPLDCPMLVLHGSNDGLVSDAGLSGWLAETIGAVRYVGFSGGHFFMHGEEAGVLAEVRRELERVLARAAQDEPNGMREPAARMSHLTEESGT